MTHTYAVLEISAEAFDEISKKLNDAGYYTAFDNKGLRIDMEGIALVREEEPEKPVPPPGRILGEGEKP